MARFLIGIDLGTTNSALSFVDLERLGGGSVPGRRDIQTFAVPQLIGPGQMGERPLLPSFLYLPAGPDLPPGAAQLPWDSHASDIVGEFARQHGSRIPGRLVSSAKSWLCHAGVDRTAPLLPWGAPPDVKRLSPLEVSTRYLKHFVQAWKAASNRRPEDQLENQTVVLTVPASFDDTARTLTVEAAHQAGLKHLTLLEEPQAAFYAWLGLHTSNELLQLKPGMRCLVVDIGGGTSDFSLIQASEDKGELAFTRQAVGDHLLLGGDNMDLALARFVEAKLSGKLDAAQFGQLVQACRAAKEVLLGPSPPASVPITIAGRGRAVIGGALHATLTPDEVKTVLFDGFLPLTPLTAEPQRPPRGGLTEMGLPYVSDPAISRHLAQFLVRHLGSSPPDAILFNGGVFQPALLRQRLVEVLTPWYSTTEKPWKPLVLSNPSLDLAVAWGAAYAAWLAHSGGRRIGGGTARSYYVAIETGETQAANDSRTVLCVVPRQLKEGEEVALSQPTLELALGEPAVFPLFTSTVRGDDQPGDVLSVSPEQLRSLPPVHTLLRGGKKAGSTARRVPVRLAARCTEIGTLELSCVAVDGSNRWKLEFGVRESGSELDDSDKPPAIADVWPEALVEKAGQLIRSCYVETGEPNPAPRELTRALETALEASRGDWPSGLCRRMWDFFLERAEQRRRSPDHLARWFHLVGWVLRPGFGDPLDRYRIDQLWKLLNAPRKTTALTTPAGTGQVTRPAPGGAVVPEGGADFWIMWRRTAGGLSGALQQALLDRMRPVLIPSKGKPVAKPNPNELAEMWRCAASLERLNPSWKEQLGHALLKQVRKPPVPAYAFWSLTRLGARVLLYGPLNTVLHPEIVSSWLEQLLGFEPTHDSERRDWCFCLAQLARRSGQRALDVDDEWASRVASVLAAQTVPEPWRTMVREVVALEGEERGQLFGDTLPIGLRLRH